jgi:mono/diheme cytochrome c family protein
VYTDYCLGCHGADGKGLKIKGMEKIPDFTSPKWQDEHKEAELITSILEGKKPFMPPMKDKLSRDDAGRMADFVRAFRGGKQAVKVEEKLVVPPPPTRPEVIPDAKKPKRKRPPGTPTAQTAAQIRVATGLYRQYCLTCHGNNGKGAADMRRGMPRLPDLTNRRWQESMSDPQLRASILDGKDLMPAFRDHVTDTQVKALVAYIRALGPARPRPKEEAPPGDFEKRFQQLREEWDELQRQLDALKGKPARR